MKKGFKQVIFWGLLCCAFASPRLHADDSMPSLLGRFDSSDPDTRRVAFSSAIARPEVEKGAPYKKALIRLLKTEITYSTSTPVIELQDDDEWNAYFKNLIIAVSSLRDPESITPLLNVIDKGDEATQALASFGPDVLNAVIPKTADPNPGIRLASMTVLFEMFEPENEIKVTDPAVRKRIEGALKSGLHDKDPYIKNTATEAMKKLKILEKPPESTY